jgi:uncharacterized membrane protein YkoI
MRMNLAIVLGLSLIPALGVFADSEKKVQMKDLPPAVQQAVKEQSKGATVRGLAMEAEKGKTTYEAELTVNGHGKDVSFDAAGKVVSVEEEVTLESLPEAARAAIQKSAGTGKVTKVESVMENGTSFYEAAISKGGKTSEFKVDAKGAPVK